VNLKSVKSISETLLFYMGKNTPDRRDFIMENLI
jgi:topoisomerase IV subunit B